MSEWRELSTCPEREGSVELTGAVIWPVCASNSTRSDEADAAGTSALSGQAGNAVEALLLREIGHRINNEFASAISLISVTAKRCKNPEARAALAAIEGRLHSYAKVEQSLRRPEHSETIELAVYLDRLCRAIGHSKLESRGIELSVLLSPVSISAERGWLLGMIVFELITNAARHAFGGGGGSIQVELSRSGRHATCCIGDNGAVAGRPTRGTGLRIVEALAVRLDGTFDLRFGPDGTVATIDFAVE